jgi:hypothetical protein
MFQRTRHFTPAFRPWDEVEAKAAIAASQSFRRLMWLDAGLDVAPEELLGPVPPTVGRGRRNELAMSTARNRQANGIPTLRQHNEVNGLNHCRKSLWSKWPNSQASEGDRRLEIDSP